MNSKNRGLQRSLLVLMMLTSTLSGQAWLKNSQSPERSPAFFREVISFCKRALTGPSSRSSLPVTLSDISDPIVRKWLDYRQNELKYDLPLTQGQSIQIRGSSYEIQALLGLGSEAFVYLVKTNEGLRVAKVFRNRGQMELNLTVPRDKNSGLPKILARDFERHTILTEYFEGVPFNEIEKHWEKLGISVDEKRRIAHNFYLLFGAQLVTSNFVYSFKEDKYFTIDPF